MTAGGLMKGFFGSLGSTLGTEATPLYCVLLFRDVCVFWRWPSWNVRREQEAGVPHLPLSSSSLCVSLKVSPQHSPERVVIPPCVCVYVGG